MTKEDYLKLTSTVYRIIGLFPESEPLRNKTKEKAIEIMENLVLLSSASDFNQETFSKEKTSVQVLKDIEILKSYLKLGKSQGWLDSLNLLILLKEYDKIREEIKPAVKVMQRSDDDMKIEEKINNNNNIENNGKSAAFSDNLLSDRQQKIIKILEERKRAQVADFKKILPQISKRTLRRDLDDLLNKNKVMRAGEWNQVFYQLS